MAKKQQESQKTKASKRQQSASDKTFGLKNKNKSSKVQSYVKQVESQAQTAGDAKRKQAEAERRRREKQAAEEARQEAQKLFTPVAVQKVPFGVNPKSVLCVFFKQGTCTKGQKCKFAHDLDIERKALKKDLYTDVREEKEADTMDKWDEAKLRSVIMSKHGNPKTTTDIVCKFFIKAVENGKYGWFWTCPNGGDTCKYKHSLPPGFVLKTREQQKLERQAAANTREISLEEFIESERLKLPKQLTPVTWDSFSAWKAKRLQSKAADLQTAASKAKTLSGKQYLKSDQFFELEDSDDENKNDALSSEIWNMSEIKRRAAEAENDRVAKIYD